MTIEKKSKARVKGLKEHPAEETAEAELNEQVDPLAHLSEEDRKAVLELVDLCSQHDRSPDLVHLVHWKEAYGKYFASSVDGGDLYIWRTLKRLEYKGMSSTGVMDSQEGFESALMKKCMLWPKIDSEFMSDVDAGVPSSIFKQIMHQSGFIGDEEVLQLIRRI